MESLYQLGDCTNVEIEFKWIRLGLRARCCCPVLPPDDLCLQVGAGCGQGRLPPAAPCLAPDDLCLQVGAGCGQGPQARHNTGQDEVRQASLQVAILLCDKLSRKNILTFLFS